MNTISRIQTGTSLLRIALVLGSLTVATQGARAIDPTELQTAKGMEGKTIELQQKLKFEEHDEEEWISDTSIEYEFNPKWALRLKAPLEFSEDEGDHLGDLELRLKHVFNPDSQTGFVAAGTAAATFPTGDESNGFGADLRLRLSQWELGANDKHGLHATLIGKYHSDPESGDARFFREDEPGEREFRWQAVLGYTYQVAPSTRLVLDVVAGQGKHHGEGENLLEAGITHQFSDAVSVAVGVGAGLDDDSPDVVARAGIQIRF